MHLGNDLVGDAFGTEQAAGATAAIEESVVEAEGLVSITATSAVDLSSIVANTRCIGIRFDGRNGASIGANGDE